MVFSEKGILLEVSGFLLARSNPFYCLQPWSTMSFGVCLNRIPIETGNIYVSCWLWSSERGNRSHLRHCYLNSRHLSFRFCTLPKGRGCFFWCFFGNTPTHTMDSINLRRTFVSLSPGRTMTPENVPWSANYRRKFPHTHTHTLSLSLS